jgi:DNA-directed RNA polymerase specialized sigma24 family protein
MDPAGDASLHLRAGGTLIERRVASGTMASMVKRFMLEVPSKRREFIIMHDGMEFHAAEIQNLAGQHVFSLHHKRDGDKPVERTPRRVATITLPD